MKRCTACMEEQPLSEFYRCAAAKDGLQWQCKPCRRSWLAANRDKTRAQSRAYRAQNPEVTRRRLPNVPSRVKLSPPEYDALLDAQDYLCAICRQPESAPSRSGKPLALAVDHCHETQVVRGLLCNRCNRGLGAFRDSPHLLRTAANYLSGGSEAPSVLSAVGLTDGWLRCRP